MLTILRIVSQQTAARFDDSEFPNGAVPPLRCKHVDTILVIANELDEEPVVAKFATTLYGFLSVFDLFYFSFHF